MQVAVKLLQTHPALTTCSPCSRSFRRSGRPTCVACRSTPHSRWQRLRSGAASISTTTPAGRDYLASSFGLFCSCRRARSIRRQQRRSIRRRVRPVGDIIKARTSPGSYPIRYGLYQLAVWAWDMVGYRGVARRQPTLFAHWRLARPNGWRKLFRIASSRLLVARESTHTAMRRITWSAPSKFTHLWTVFPDAPEEAPCHTLEPCGTG